MPTSAAGRPHSSSSASAARWMCRALVSKAIAAEPRASRSSALQSVGQTLLHELLDALQHLLGVLARHQPAGDLHRRLRGDHGLGADALVAAGDAVELHRRARPDLLEHAVAALARGLAQAHGAQELAGIEAEPSPLLELLGRGLPDAVVEAGDAHLAVVVVHLGHDPGQRPDRVHGGAAVAARVQIAAGAGDDELGAGEAAQLRRDRRRVLVPLAGVAHERQVGLHLLAVLGQEPRQRRRAALLLALEQHGDGDRRGAGHAPPGPHRLEEGHQLALVVLGAARHDDLAVGLVGGDARLERRRLPQLERVDRLHIVVAVEQHVRALAVERRLGVAHHHGMAGGRHHAGIEADVLQLARAPLRGLLALRLIGGIGGDAEGMRISSNSRSRASLWVASSFFRTFGSSALICLPTVGACGKGGAR